MRRVLIFIIGPLLIIGLGSCGLFRPNTFKYEPVVKEIPKLEIEILVQDSTLNVRALEVVESGEFKGPSYLTSEGEFGVIYPNSVFKHIDSVKDKSFYNHKVSLANDTLKLNFRALGVTERGGFGITIGSPALLYKLDADLEKNKIVYQENHPKAFYDSMEFWNDQEGIAIGDSTDGCLSVIITRDGGILGLN